MTLDRLKAPGKNFDLRNWKLTLPDAKEISPQMLNDGYIKPGFFYTSERNGGMVFECPNIAGTTEHTHYSRSELRELLRPQFDASDPRNNWRASDGGTLIARCSVDRVSTSGDPAKLGRVVIGQIHGPETEVVRLYYHKLPSEDAGRVYAGFDDVDNNNEFSRDIARNIPLGKRFTYTIRLRYSKLRIFVRTSPEEINTLGRKIDSRYLGLDLYFKAGVYNQNNTGDAGDGVKATFFSLRHEHP